MPLYFIAIAPDELLSEKIRVIQKDFSDRFNAHKSLNNFPHITLARPFECGEHEENQLMETFENIRLTAGKFILKLNGFGSFPNPKSPVIFIQPEPSPQLERLYSEINTGMHFTKTGKFHPHLTVAYRDLSFEHYGKAWQEYRDRPFSAEFEVQSVGLYKHSGRKWNAISEKKLAG